MDASIRRRRPDEPAEQDGQLHFATGGTLPTNQFVVDYTCELRLIRQSSTGDLALRPAGSAPAITREMANHGDR